MTRDDILEAAAQIIAQKGFHAASMQDIAEAVDLRKASLYHHVSSKQEILVDLLDQALDMLIERMEAVVTQDLPAMEKFRMVMQAYLGLMLERRDLASVLLLEHRSLEPDKRLRHIPRRDRFEALWRSVIEDGVAEGVFNTEDPGLAIKSVLGVANWTVMWYQPDGRLSADEIIEQNVEILLNGLCSR
ncbi:TetR/AcrR family transcriptional regulator [Chloroflexota bacterium]